MRSSLLARLGGIAVCVTCFSGPVWAIDLFADQGAPFCFDRNLLRDAPRPPSSDTPTAAAGCTAIGAKRAKVVLLEPKDAPAADDPQPVYKVRLYSRDGDTSYVGYMRKSDILEEKPRPIAGPAAGTAQILPATVRPKRDDDAVPGVRKSPSLVPMQPPPEPKQAAKPATGPTLPCRPAPKPGTAGAAPPQAATAAMSGAAAPTCR
ncbi:MAG: hypothetical protein JO038_09870 [Alphaproteobacteria bacterium]|nr:hypothetical protein [Alphaproteobacteria bacterium]